MQIGPMQLTANSFRPLYHDKYFPDISLTFSTRSSAIAKRPCDASCLYSFNTKVERSLLLLVVSASDILLRTIKFFSVLFSSAYSSMLQAVTNKH